MTVIAAIATIDHVVMACDTRYDYSGTGLYAEHGKIGELFTPRGDKVLIAATGSGSLLSMVMRNLQLDNGPDPSDATSADEWAAAVADAITELLAESKPSGLAATDGAEHINGTFLIAWRQYMWWLYTHTAIRAYGPVLALGSGCEVALGSLNTAVRAQMAPEEAVDFAVRLACQHASGCGIDVRGPLIHSTKGD
ncbi:hypothetical protein [Nocardia aurea]|uniref:hypothetical protein n=1 Tax=Nocardia aurea TaxID=2144174 RepID=UPI0033BB66C3